MKDFFTLVISEQYRILHWFFAAIVLIYIPGVFIWLGRKKRKSEQYEMAHPNAVKAFIGRSEYSDILTVYTVNGNEPVMHSRQIWYGFYLRPGKNVIEAQYQWTTISVFSISGYETHVADSVRMEVIAELGREYKLYYDHDQQEYIFKEWAD